MSQAADAAPATPKLFQPRAQSTVADTPAIKVEVSHSQSVNIDGQKMQAKPAQAKLQTDIAILQADISGLVCRRDLKVLSDEQLKDPKNKQEQLQSLNLR